MIFTTVEYRGRYYCIDLRTLRIFGTYSVLEHNGRRVVVYGNHMAIPTEVASIVQWLALERE